MDGNNMDQNAFYNEYVKPYLKKGNRQYNRMRYLNSRDILWGQLSSTKRHTPKQIKLKQRQVLNWIFPPTNDFLPPEEQKLKPEQYRMLYLVPTRAMVSPKDKPDETYLVVGDKGDHYILSMSNGAHLPISKKAVMNDWVLHSWVPIIKSSHFRKG